MNTDESMWYVHTFPESTRLRSLRLMTLHHPLHRSHALLDYGLFYIFAVGSGAIMIFGSLAVIHYYKTQGIIPVELPYVVDRTAALRLESSRSQRSSADPADHVGYLKATRSRIFKAVQSSRQKRQQLDIVF
jgi:hypothetical protein